MRKIIALLVVIFIAAIIWGYVSAVIVDKILESKV